MRGLSFSGTDVKAADQDGHTALHMAAFTGAASIVKVLVDRGASVDARNKLGETPWSMAAGMSPVLRYRRQYGSHESTANSLSRSARSRSRRTSWTLAPPHAET
jgi:hypothetical protein